MAEPQPIKHFEQGAENKNVVYLLRTMQQHHVQLSAMADQKAGMVLATCSIILTIVIAQIGKGALPYTLLALGITAIVAVLFAIMAVMPRVTLALFGDSGNNLMFFGSFAQLTFADFLEKIAPAVNDNEELFTAMLRDTYQLGRVLYCCKYKYLRYSYRLLVIGLIVTSIVGVSEFMLTTAP